jgi:hypothetical protein
MDRSYPSLPKLTSYSTGTYEWSWIGNNWIYKVQGNTTCPLIKKIHFRFSIWKRMVKSFRRKSCLVFMFPQCQWLRAIPLNPPDISIWRLSHNETTINSNNYFNYNGIRQQSTESLMSRNKNGSMVGGVHAWIVPNQISLNCGCICSHAKLHHTLVFPNKKKWVWATWGYG